MESIYQFVLCELDKAAAARRLPTVAAESGVALTTVRKIQKREVEDPRVSNVEQLATYFRGQ